MSRSPRPDRHGRPHPGGLLRLPHPMPGHRPARRLAGLLLMALVAGSAWLAQPARAAGESAVDAAERLLSRLVEVAPETLALKAPGAPSGPVVPSQVLRWREEASAFEHGEGGHPRDAARAATLYCQAARHGDAESQFALAWMLTHGRGIERDDAAAAHLFSAAAEQGMPQAQRMAAQLGTPRGDPPPCLRPPETDASSFAAAKPAAAPAARPAPPGARTTGPATAVAALPRPVTEHPLYQRAPRPIADFVRLVAPDYQLPAQLVLAVMATESAFNPNAVSPRNAQGLMQLIPDTAARFKVRNILDPAQNIRGGMAYLRWLLAYFEGNLPLALAAYNAGEGAVDRYRGIPPYAETRNYVVKVMGLFGEGALLPYDKQLTRPSAALAGWRLAAQ